MKRALVLVIALVLVPQAGSEVAKLRAPTALNAFQLRLGEAAPPGNTYPVMPAFSWRPVLGATHYQIQLADNQSFSDASVLYQNSNLGTPVASIQYQVPWMSGQPYALWVHVRAVAGGTISSWSKPFGFNTGWQNIPAELSAPKGLIRWTPVEGATGYQVWFTNIDREFTTLTNTADEREYWTLHPGLAGKITWRVRAIRRTVNPSLKNGNSITPYGPWSPVFTTLTSGSIDSGPLRGGVTESDVTKGPMALMPSFSWSGTDGSGAIATGDHLWRVYVYSDKKCVNPVLVGSMTGSPAWAPRAVSGLAFPTTQKDFQDAISKGTILAYGSEGKPFMADLTPVTPSEDAGSAGSTPGSTTPPGTSTPSSTTPSSTAPSSSTPSNGTTVSLFTPGAVELPDSGWPTGRYWWTVVPVYVLDVFANGSTTSADGDAVEYHDAELPQDACAAGRVWSFSLRSSPATTTAGATPYASGVTPGARLLAAAGRSPSFVKLPLVTWRPALGAQSYEIQLSRTSYPWKVATKFTSLVTSAVLPLTTHSIGTWYYRVRGLNPNLPTGAQKMTWSAPVKIKIVGSVVKILR